LTNRTCKGRFQPSFCYYLVDPLSLVKPLQESRGEPTWHWPHPQKTPGQGFWPKPKVQAKVQAKVTPLPRELGQYHHHQSEIDPASNCNIYCNMSQKWFQFTEIRHANSQQEYNMPCNTFNLVRVT
jgi:hypothetical protein